MIRGEPHEDNPPAFRIGDAPTEPPSVRPQRGKAVTFAGATGADRMERLWSLAGATNGNPWPLRGWSLCAAQRGSKRRAKTDRADCDLQLKLLLAGELPESWIPPAHILELRTRVRTRKTLVDQRSAWQLRLTAQLFHQGVPAGINPRTRAGREALARVELSPAGRELVSLALRMIDVPDLEIVPLDRELRAFAARQPGCRALSERLYGVGPVTATAVLAELGDCRRFSSSDDAVRHAGLDVTVYQSDSKRAAGHLSHEGPPVLRWALYEAGQQATRQTSPDHAYFLQVRERTDHKSASLSVARKLCRRAFHILRELGEQALAPVDVDAHVEEAMHAAA